MHWFKGLDKHLEPLTFVVGEFGVWKGAQGR